MDDGLRRVSEKVMQVASLLDVTPVRARNYMTLRDGYKRRTDMIISLNQSNPVDKVILEALWWLKNQ